MILFVDFSGWFLCCIHICIVLWCVKICLQVDVYINIHFITENCLCGTSMTVSCLVRYFLGKRFLKTDRFSFLPLHELWVHGTGDIDGCFFYFFKVMFKVPTSDSTGGYHDIIHAIYLSNTTVKRGLSLQLGKTGGYLGDYIAFFLIWQLVASSCGNQRLSAQHLQSLGVSFWLKVIARIACWEATCDSDGLAEVTNNCCTNADSRQKQHSQLNTTSWGASWLYSYCTLRKRQVC